MTHALLYLAGAVVTLAAFASLMRRYLLRPIRAAGDRLHVLVEQAMQVEEHRHELAELAGSVIQLARVLVEGHQAIGERLAQTTGLVVELNDDVHQLRGEVAELRERIGA